jgi:hypothetical protein
MTTSTWEEEAAADETLFDKRITQLGFAHTLSIAATITPQTMALLRTEQAQPAQPAQSPTSQRAPVAESVDIVAEQLPRISIDEREIVAPVGLTRYRPDYAILSTLGEGGMGRVHLARQRSLARDVALKTLKPGATSGVSGALLREARITGALEHPGVIPVHVLGLDDNDRPMLVMKRVDGVELGTLLADQAHPAWSASGRSKDRLVASLEILIQVCLTLEFAHSRGILHRDIKPENIMVGSFGEVYLLDWGIATAAADVKEGELVGTPVYMAPEMALGRSIDERTDVYLVGATLHEMLAGSVRHDGKTIIEVMRSAMVSKPFDYPPTVPEELAVICNRSTARKPSSRHASVKALREEIAAFLRHRSARALSDIAFERLVELERLLLDAGAGAGAAAADKRQPKELARAYRLATEARFGLTQSLREHAEDDTARSGMRRCLALSIDLELRQDHADTAEALLREMDDPDPELAKRIEEVRKRTAAHAREHERLELLDRDLDPTEQASKRGRWIVIMGLIVVTAGLTATQSTTPLRILVAGAIATTVIAVGVFFVRKSVLTNAFNRRLYSALMLSMLTVLAHRVIGYLMNHNPVDTMMVDHLIFFAAIISWSITLMRRLALSAAPFAIGLVATPLLPGYAVRIFIAATTTSLLIAAAVLTTAKRPGGTP